MACRSLNPECVRQAIEKQLSHAFHTSLTEIGRPVAANLIEGSRREVISFLDALANGGASATGVGNSQPAWRRTLAAAPWSHLFIENDTGTNQ